VRHDEVRRKARHNEMRPWWLFQKVTPYLGLDALDGGKHHFACVFLGADGELRATESEADLEWPEEMTSETEPGLSMAR